MKLERLDKLLCGAGLYTRAQARRLIAAGGVTVDGEVVRKADTKVSREADIIAAGQPVDGAEFVYYMMNKPAGYVSASKDEGSYPAVTSLLPADLRRRRLFCVGRLDVDVTGLLLLTDDGGFAHRVTAPRSDIPKTYRVRVDGTLTPDDVKALASGVTLHSGAAYRPAGLSIDAADPAVGFITVTEGKYHEVKNLMAFCGRRVLSMARLSVGMLTLDPSLEPGQIRRLSMEETEKCFI